MSDQLVPPRRTKFTTNEFIKSLIQAWNIVFQTQPTKEQVGVVWAHYVHETGGGNACWNYNVCNIKKGSHAKYFMLPGTWEIVNGKKVVFYPPHPATWFRDYDSLKEGMCDYLKFVSGKRYKAAWESVLKGSPEDFSHKLKIAGYYTATEEKYTRILKVYFDKFMKTSSYEETVKPLESTLPVVVTEKTVTSVPIIIAPIHDVVIPPRDQKDMGDFKLTLPKPWYVTLTGIIIKLFSYLKLGKKSNK